MGWFSGSIKKVMRAAQKRHAVPLNKARKIDVQLENALTAIQDKYKHSTNNEGVQLQAAMRAFYSRVSVVKHIERDLVSMAEDIAVDEKVVNQLLGLQKFANSTWLLLEKDFKDTYRDFKRMKKKWDLTSEVSEQRRYVDQQLNDLKVLIPKLELALSSTQSAMESGGEFHGRNHDTTTRTNRVIELENSIKEAKRYIAQLLAARASTKLASDLGIELYDYWKNLTVKLDKHELPSISFLSDKKHKKEIENMRKLIDQELASIMMAMKELNDELVLFESICVEVLSKSRKRRLVRSIQQLAMEQ